ncbi:MAG: hypothetical protein DRI84_09120 [Bacteroidetes bacterium]|nr:MAG: hypothetical protein DRI84_09120 [Bacteroidota bacterium]
MIKKARNIVLIIGFIILGLSSSYAQFGFGLRIGGASTSLTGVGANMEEFRPEPKLKLVAGGVINYSFGRRIALQTEILYSGKGSAMKYYYQDDVLRGEVSLDLRLGYLAVPLIFQFKMGDRDNYFHFDAGIVFNQLVHTKYTGTILAEDDKGNKVDQIFELDAEPNAQDFGYTLGIGLVANGLLFDFSYEIGARDVYPSTTDGLNIRNRSFKVSIGYIFKY